MELGRCVKILLSKERKERVQKRWWSRKWRKEDESKKHFEGGINDFNMLYKKVERQFKTKFSFLDWWNKTKNEKKLLKLALGLLLVTFQSTDKKKVNLRVKVKVVFDCFLRDWYESQKKSWGKNLIFLIC